MKKFSEFGLSEKLVASIEKKGFEEPTPIQELTIPLLLNGEFDLIGQAQTGTGKTAAFGIPLIEKLDEKANYVQALILTPTRELAIQVSEEINSLKNKALHVVPIYGGQSIELQLKSLKKGVHIVIGTPGRIIDHIKRKTLHLDKISFLVLDEADEMLDMGFIDDIKLILESTNTNKRMLFFSATMPQEILKIAKKYMKDYKFISVDENELVTPLTDQIYFEVYEKDKFEALCRIIDVENDFYGLVFCRTKVDVDVLNRKLTDRGYDVEALHGDIQQSQREKILRKFKDQRINILVATDVAARGIDIVNLTHVINYSIPQNQEYYIHRIGRTGRAGKEGTAITFVTPSEYSKLHFYKKMAKTNIRREKLPEIEDIITIKKERIKDNIKEIIEKQELTEYLTIASEILENNDSIQSLAAVLKYAFQDELSDRNYGQIQEITTNNAVDKTGKTRLFIAMGKMDKMTPKKLIEFLKKEVRIDDRKINDIRILEKFSFVTVPFKTAELILDAFKQKKRGKKPIIEMADKAKK